MYVLRSGEGKGDKKEDSARSRKALCAMLKRLNLSCRQEITEGKCNI